MEESVFDKIALYFEFQFNKNSLLQCYFLVFCPTTKIAKKSSMEESVYDNITLYFEFQFNKNSLLQCYFLVFCPTTKIAKKSSVEESVFLLYGNAA